MISTENIIKLIEAFKASDSESLDKYIHELIKVAEKKGHVHVAKKLRELRAMPKSETGQGGGRKFFNSNASPDANKLFEFRKSKVTSNDIVLSAQNRNIFEEIKRNYENRDRLKKHGLSEEIKVLLYGHPGTGKTLFAYALAGDLGIPVLHIYIDVLISSYLGETGKNIKSIFQEAFSQECILFLDEFDAIAKQRDDQQELGELKRVVTVLLQNIDELSPNNILIAATNHEHLLDKAIWRRFDYQLNLGYLDKSSLTKLYSLLLKDFKKIDFELLAELSEGISGALIRQIVEKSLKRNFLEGKNTDELQDLILLELIKNFSARKEIPNDAKMKKILAIAIRSLKKANKKYTYEFLAEVTGMPHSTLHYLTRK